eukprot:8545434-Lingulodinium_polyedra.AAC.1
MATPVPPVDTRPPPRCTAGGRTPAPWWPPFRLRAWRSSPTPGVRSATRVACGSAVRSHRQR